MKVYNLQCQLGHGFEGWFSSEDEYDSQQARGLVTCPVCDSGKVQRMPTAPRLNLGHVAPETSASNAVPDVAPTGGAGGGGSAGAFPAALAGVPQAQSDEKSQMLAAWLMAAKHVVDNTEDVGTQFAKEATKMHHGEVPDRPIRGHATPQEKEALREDGIEVAEMLLPAFLTKPLQ